MYKEMYKTGERKMTEENDLLEYYEEIDEAFVDYYINKKEQEK